MVWVLPPILTYVFNFFVLGTVDFAVFCANYSRWANKQLKSDLADSELTLSGDIGEIGLGVDRLVGVFAARGIKLSEEELLTRLGGFLKFRNLVSRIDNQPTTCNPKLPHTLPHCCFASFAC